MGVRRLALGGKKKTQQFPERRDENGLRHEASSKIEGGSGESGGKQRKRKMRGGMNRIFQ